MQHKFKLWGIDAQSQLLYCLEWLSTAINKGGKGSRGAWCQKVCRPVLARILCSLLTKSAMYCLLTVLEEPADERPI